MYAVRMQHPEFLQLLEEGWGSEVQAGATPVYLELGSAVKDTDQRLGSAKRHIRTLTFRVDE